MNAQEAKAAFAAGTITTDQYVEALENDNRRLQTRADAGNELRLKISDKQGLSVYGLGRFPVTLYKSQWIRLLAHAKTIAEFIKTHDSELADKADKVAKAA